MLSERSGAQIGHITAAWAFRQQLRHFDRRLAFKQIFELSDKENGLPFVFELDVCTCMQLKHACCVRYFVTKPNSLAL